MNKKITENDLYAKLRKEREELYKIIGKEGITDQKVRIDKYAHLYVLQDEMTEYLRARRLSQAEIEKLYAVENFYEYIQNYLLHHKDVFNYCRKKKERPRSVREQLNQARDWCESVYGTGCGES